MNTKEYLASLVKVEANFNTGYNEKIVKRLLGCDLTYPLNMEDLLTQCDIEVVTTTELSETKGRIIFNNERYTLTTSKRYGKMSQRYVQATLLARLIFEHAELKTFNYYDDKFICDGSGIRIVERPHNYKANHQDKRAMRFAAEILMPKPEVVNFLNEQKTQAQARGEKVYQREFINICAEHYCLSEIAVINQLKRIGIISQE